jgi:SAM-dependent methyltransferase
VDDKEAYYEAEKQKWDGLMHQRYADPETLRYEAGHNFYKYCDRDSMAYGVKEFLGDLKDKKVLEFGCGAGHTAGLMALCGADVTAFDISEESVAVTNRRAEVNNLPNLKAEVAVGEDLPYPDEAFDIVFGRAVLHHLDVKQAAGELARVLKPGGKACFIEPMGMNPVLNFVRDYVPYPNKNPVGDDSPLVYKEIKEWGAWASDYRWTEVQLLGMIERAFPFKWKVKLPFLHKMDRVIMKYVPFTRRFARYVVLYMVK